MNNENQRFIPFIYKLIIAIVAFIMHVYYFNGIWCC